MIHTIFPCIWFNGNAKEAATYYCTIFEGARVKSDSPMVVRWNIFGKDIMGLNGGPMFKINSSISLFVSFNREEELDLAYNKLIDDGEIHMELGAYAWAKKYAYVKDKFGVGWQLMLMDGETHNKIWVSFLFSNRMFGKAKEAVAFYTDTFKESKIHVLDLYKENESQVKGNLKFSSFSIHNTIFSAMDGPGNEEFSFNEAFSMVVTCDTQEEIDYYWDKLTANDGEESMCGWLKDKYGMSWQIIPAVLGSLMSDPNTSQKTIDAFMKMKKLIIKDLY